MYHQGESSGDTFFWNVNFGFTDAMGILILEP